MLKLSSRHYAETHHWYQQLTGLEMVFHVFEAHMVVIFITPRKVGKTWWLFQWRGCTKPLLHHMWTKSSTCYEWRSHCGFSSESQEV